MATYRQIRVIVEGSSSFGRQVVEGVFRYVRDARLRWRIHVELKPHASRGSDWEHDEATICAVPDHELVQRLSAMDHPLINCLAHYEEMGIPTVRVDDQAIGRMAAEHLLERGLERFMFWSSGDRSRAAWLRLGGMKQLLEPLGYSVRTVPQSWGDPQVATRQYPTTHIVDALRETTFPIGVFCSHDTLGRIALTELASAGIAVPEQVAVISADNDVFQCQISYPPLTSIELPYEQVGFEAAHQVDRLLNRRRPPRQPIVLEPHGVITRKSTDIIAVSDPRLAEAVRFMREHACDPCNVENVLEHLQCSRRWLESQFKRQFHRSPHDELTRVRMDRARLLLRTTTLPIPSIAEQSGYTLVQNFGRVFKQHFGHTPAAYREQYNETIAPHVRPSNRNASRRHT